MRERDLGALTVADFEGLVSGKFRVTLPSGGATEFELIEATAEKPRSRPSESKLRTEPFSLIFRGPFETPLPQRIYRIENEAFGAVEIFLVPLGSQGDPLGTHYQAIFN